MKVRLQHPTIAQWSTRAIQKHHNTTILVKRRIAMKSPQASTTVRQEEVSSGKTTPIDDDTVIDTEFLCRSDEKTSLSSQSSSLSNRTGVSFGSVEVREYERIIDGDHEVLAALSIGWRYLQCEPTPVNPLCCPDRETKSQTTVRGCTSGSDRIDLLIDYGFSLREIQQAEGARQDMMYGCTDFDDEGEATVSRVPPKKVAQCTRQSFRGKVASWITSTLIRRQRTLVEPRRRKHQLGAAAARRAAMAIAQQQSS